MVVNGDRGTTRSIAKAVLLTEFFLDDFSDDEWYRGFSDYIDWCGIYLSAADAGQPFSDENPPRMQPGLLFDIAVGIGLALLAAVLLTALIMAGLMRRMKSVEPASCASAYVSGQLPARREERRLQHDDHPRARGREEQQRRGRLCRAPHRAVSRERAVNWRTPVGRFASAVLTMSMTGEPRRISSAKGRRRRWVW